MNAEVFETLQVPAEPDGMAPDGAEVSVLLALAGGSMAEFFLQPDQTSIAVRHLSVEELWYVLDGTGEMWRSSSDGTESVVELTPGTCVSIPVGTTFQFRSLESGLRAVGVTMPPWPVDRIEAVRVEPSQWQATLAEGPGLGPLE